MFDGAIVNPVPVSVARALGAERVIAFNISSDSAGRGTAVQEPFGRAAPEGLEAAAVEQVVVRTRWRRAPRRAANPDAAPPGLLSVMVNAFDILQDRIMRSRLAGDPPDALVQVKVGKIGMFEFNRAEDLIAIGREAVRKAAAEIAERIEAPGMAGPGV
jgi:NTE family protein